MDKDELKAIKARCAARTDGPWSGISEFNEAKALFASHACEDVPALVTRVEELEKALDDAIVSMSEYFRDKYKVADDIVALKKVLKNE